MSYFMRVLLAGLVLFSNGAFAVDYYWLNGADNISYVSPALACQGAADHYTSTTSYTLTVEKITFNSASSGYCHLLRDGVPRLMGTTLSRRGDSCPAGTEYNSETGECVPEPNQCEAGESSSFEFLYCYDYEGTDTCVNKKPRPPTFCQSSCLYIPDYNPETSDADCYAYQNGDGTSGPAVFCSVTAVTNGSECSGEYTPDTPDNSCPAGTVSGQVDGKNVCVPSGDGGGDGGDNGGGDGGDDGGGDGGDNGGGDGDGTGGGDGDGTGGNGNGNGSGGDGDGTGGNGDGTGGTGTGGDGDGEGDGSGSAEGIDNCESGRCDFGDDRGDPFDGEVRSFADSLSAAMSGMKNSPLGSSIGNIQFPTGGSCPTGSTSIATPFGPMSIDFESHCTLWEQIASILSAVFLAFWAILAVRVFLSA